MNNEDGEEAIFSKIDKEIKDQAQRYVTESKIRGVKDTDSFKNLIEISLRTYMDSHELE